MLSPNGTSTTGSPQLATSGRHWTWTQVLDDEFIGTTINTNVWKVYDNPDPTGKHLARNVVVGGGFVSLKTRFDTTLGVWMTAGMRTLPTYFRTYGKYEMSVRTSAGDSRVDVLLWPDTSGVWPPEIDWMEMDGSIADQASRQSSTQTVHYGTSSQNFMIHTKHAADMTQWHAVGLEWGPGYVRYLLDGVVTDQVVTQVVSSTIMYLGLQTSPDQTEALTGPVNMDVDWLKIYRYEGGSGMAPTVPLNVSATGGDGSATVTWDPPASEGNSRLSSYTVTASPSSGTKTVTYASPNPSGHIDLFHRSHAGPGLHVHRDGYQPLRYQWLFRPIGRSDRDRQPSYDHTAADGGSGEEQHGGRDPHYLAAVHDGHLRCDGRQ